MKKLLSIILTLALVLGLSAVALADGAGTEVSYPVEGGNIYFNTGTGKVTRADDTVVSADIPTEINGVTVKEIGYNAFGGCRLLTGVTIPDGVTTIGERAFYGCSALTGVVIPRGVTVIADDTFYGCDSLTSVSIPDGATAIEDRAFMYCESLTDVDIPDSVTAIGYQAFYGCDSLTAVSIPDSVTTIGVAAFSQCRYLENITVDNNNTSYASVDGVLLTKDGKILCCYPSAKKGTAYSIPEGVTKIDDNAFALARKLTEIVIPNSVTEIGSDAFVNCASLTGISIPASVIKINDAAFLNCPKISSITVDKGNTSYKSVDGVLFSYDGTTLVLYPATRQNKQYSIPDGTTIIGTGAFFDSALTDITIPDSVEIIGSQAFFETSLTNITVPDGVAEIPTQAFSYSKKLARIYLPATLTSIGSWALDDCPALTDIYFGGTEDQWSKLGYSSNLPEGVTVHFNSLALAPAFSDVSASYWGTEYIDFATSHKIMNGTGGSAFSPDDAMNLGMALTVMARVAGVDTAAVQPWYQAGFDWAAEKGIHSGGKDTDPVERQDLLLMLWKLADSPDADVKLLDKFPDAASVRADCRTAVAWAVEKGITTGSARDGATYLDPAAETSRAMYAAFVMRAYDLF